MTDIHERCRANMEKADRALRTALDEIERLRRWIYATARSLEKSGLSLDEYNAITAEVCRALEPKPESSLGVDDLGREWKRWPKP